MGKYHVLSLISFEVKQRCGKIIERICAHSFIRSNEITFFNEYLCLLFLGGSSSIIKAFNIQKEIFRKLGVFEYV